jgi:hypothetical protein
LQAEQDAETSLGVDDAIDAEARIMPLPQA